MDLKNKIAIVTGGAKGIGNGIVRALTQLGATVIINYNSSATAALELVNELNEAGGHVECVQANVSDFNEAQKLIEHVMSVHGKIDILVNNAGITADNLIMRMSEVDFDKVIDVNLKGTWNCCKHATKYMTKARYGKIVNIASVVGLIGNAGQTNYSASKAGIIGLTKSLAREVSKRNINVNAVAPGFIKTQMTEVLNENIIDQMLNTIPLGRLGEVEDVANLVAFLCSDLSSYITGQVINADGGMVMN
jgi:3-oxoacyl-[acyl-carrier protein] reductase